MNMLLDNPLSSSQLNVLGKSATAYRFRDPELSKQAADFRAQCVAADRNGRRLTKVSALGGDPEESFEQAFASLAFSYIKDKAPRLLEGLAGFQLVDRNEDNTKAVGVFGFRLGKNWVYAPVFFLNGDLKGHELLYLKGQDLFVPLKENWVNYLLAKKPHLLGDQTTETVRSLGVLQPDVRSLSIPPFYSKYGSAEATVPEGWADWAADFLPAMGHMATVSPQNDEKFASLDERFTLPVLCSESLCFARMAKQACDTYPEINRLCNKFYGSGWLKQSLNTLKDKATKEVTEMSTDILGKTMDEKDREEREEILEDVINKDASFILSGSRPAQKKAAGPAVDIRVIDDLTITYNDSDLSDSEKEQAYRDGYLVRDYRKGEETSKAYNVNFKMELANPDMSGVYDLLTKPGVFEEILIINEPTTARGKCDFATVIRTKSPKNWVNVHRATLWVRPQRRSVSDQREFFDKLDDVSKTGLSDGGTYMVLYVNSAGAIEGSTPFSVEDSMGEGRYRVRWFDSSDTGRPMYLRPTNHQHGNFRGAHQYQSSGGNWGLDDAFHGDGNLLYLNDREGVRFKSMQGTLMAPARKCKVIKVNEPDKHDSSGCCSVIFVNEHQSKAPAVEPGDWGDLQLQIIQKTAGIKIYCDNEEASINNGPLVTKKTALFHLIKEYGFREKQARDMIIDAEEARRKGKPARFRAKYAAGYPQLGPGPSAPAIPEPQYGTDDTYGGVTTQYSQTEFEGVPELSSGLTDPNVYDPRPEAMSDPMAMQGAQAAGQADQKEVFDTAMISGLLKAVRQDSMVDRYTGDLMKALDRLGRILFLFYWHNTEFMDRYGKADLPELEDSLRNTFETLGDLLLFLREKDVDPLIGGVVSEPDVQESAQ